MQDSSAKSCKLAPKQSEILQILQDFNGADGRIRTGDLILTKDALYLLSYISAVRIASNASVIIHQGGLKSKWFASK